MAQSPEQVLGFLDDLAQRSKPQALEEKQELSAFAQDNYSIANLAAWDYAYYAEKLKQEKIAKLRTQIALWVKM